MDSSLVAVRRAVRRRLLAAGLASDRLRVRVPVLAVVPLVVATVTWLSNVSDVVPFLLFPPIAAGTYVLFRDPRRARPGDFVIGVTAGAVAGWLAVGVTSGATPGLRVSPTGAALSVFLAAVVTVVIGVEEPMALSTALLVLVTGATEVAYVAGMAVTSVLVAGLFVLYRERIYEPGEQYIHRSRQGETVLVALWGSDSVAHLGARLAGSGRVVLMATADDTSGAAADRAERLADELERGYAVDCEVLVVPADSRVTRLLGTAADARAGLIVVPTDPAAPGSFEQLTRSGIDVVGLHSPNDRSHWERALVGRRSPKEDKRVHEIARLCADTVRVWEDEETTTEPAKALGEAGDAYDLLVVGASTDRSVVSRLFSLPTFYKLETTADVAVVHAGRRLHDKR